MLVRPESMSCCTTDDGTGGRELFHASPNLPENLCKISKCSYNPRTSVPYRTLIITDHVSKGTRLVPSDCECRPTDIILSSRQDGIESPGVSISCERLVAAPRFESLVHKAMPCMDIGPASARGKLRSANIVFERRTRWSTLADLRTARADN